MQHTTDQRLIRVLRYEVRVNGMHGARECATRKEANEVAERVSALYCTYAAIDTITENTATGFIGRYNVAIVQ